MPNALHGVLFCVLFCFSNFSFYCRVFHQPIFGFLIFRCAIEFQINQN